MCGLGGQAGRRSLCWPPPSSGALGRGRTLGSLCHVAVGPPLPRGRSHGHSWTAVPPPLVSSEVLERGTMGLQGKVQGVDVPQPQLYPFLHWEAASRAQNIPCGPSRPGWAGPGAVRGTCPSQGCDPHWTVHLCIHQPFCHQNAALECPHFSEGQMEVKRATLCSWRDKGFLLQCSSSQGPACLQGGRWVLARPCPC